MALSNLYRRVILLSPHGCQGTSLLKIYCNYSKYMSPFRMSFHLPFGKKSGEAGEKPVSGVNAGSRRRGGGYGWGGRARGPGRGGTQPIGVEGDSLEALRASLDDAVQAALKSFHAYVAAAVSRGGFPLGVSGALPGEPFPRVGFEPGAGGHRVWRWMQGSGPSWMQRWRRHSRRIGGLWVRPPRLHSVWRIFEPRSRARGAPPIVPPVPLPVPPVGPPPVFPGGQPPAPEPSPAVAFNFAELLRANGQRHS